MSDKAALHFWMSQPLGYSKQHHKIAPQCAFSNCTKALLHWGSFTSLVSQSLFTKWPNLTTWGIWLDGQRVYVAGSVAQPCWFYHWQQDCFDVKKRSDRKEVDLRWRRSYNKSGHNPSKWAPWTRCQILCKAQKLKASVTVAHFKGVLENVDVGGDLQGFPGQKRTPADSAGASATQRYPHLYLFTSDIKMYITTQTATPHYFSVPQLHTFTQFTLHYFCKHKHHNTNSHIPLLQCSTTSHFHPVHTHTTSASINITTPTLTATLHYFSVLQLHTFTQFTHTHYFCKCKHKHHHTTSKTPLLQGSTSHFQPLQTSLLL